MELFMDFMRAAFPWIAMGVLLAIFFVSMDNAKAHGRNNNGGLMGMLLGLVLGLSLSGCLPFSAGTCMSLGMAFGLVLGSIIGLHQQKKNLKEEQLNEKN